MVVIHKCTRVADLHHCDQNNIKVEVVAQTSKWGYYEQPCAGKAVTKIKGNSLGWFSKNGHGDFSLSM